MVEKMFWVQEKLMEPESMKERLLSGKLKRDLKGKLRNNVQK